jgi:hypothetical protein
VAALTRKQRQTVAAYRSMMSYDGMVTVNIACACGHHAPVRVPADAYFDEDRPIRSRLICQRCGKRQG